MNQSCGEDRNSRIGDVVEDGVFGFATFIQVASWRRSSDDTLLASAVLLQIYVLTSMFACLRLAYSFHGFGNAPMMLGWPSARP
jgi:hypothetical protein